MQIIGELERRTRGPYTGSMGYLNTDGSGDLNILIRTIVLQGKTATFAAGGGIVSDSDPVAELEETEAKSSRHAEGAFVTAGGTAVSANDRGLAYGDGLFETIAVRDGRLRFLEDHLERLSAGLAKLGFGDAVEVGRLAEHLRLASGDVEHGLVKLGRDAGRGTARICAACES